MREFLFKKSPVNLEDQIVLRNFSEHEVSKIICDTFKLAINSLTIQEKGTTRIEDRISLKQMRPFCIYYREHLTANKSVFSKIVSEANSGGFELRFAKFLEDASDAQAFAKNYFAVGFKLDYVKADGDLSTYMPDFILRDINKKILIIETKGRIEIDVPQKMKRLKQWCVDTTAAEENGQQYDFIFVDQIGFEKHTPKTFTALAVWFVEYK